MALFFPAKHRQGIELYTQLPRLSHRHVTAHLLCAHDSRAVFAPLFPKAGQQGDVTILASDVRPAATAIGLGQTLNSTNGTALGDDDIRLLLNILHRRISHIHLLDIQHLRRDIAIDGGRSRLIGIQTGTDAIVPIGVQHTRTADVGVAQHPLFQILQFQSFGSGGEIVGHCRRQRLGRRLDRKGVGRLSPAQCTAILLHQFMRCCGYRHTLCGKAHRHRLGTHHRHLIVTNTLDDVIPHQRAAIAAVDTVPLIAAVKALVDTGLLIQAPTAQLSFIVGGLSVFLLHLFGQEVTLGFITHSSPP